MPPLVADALSRIRRVRLVTCLVVLLGLLAAGLAVLAARGRADARVAAAGVALFSMAVPCLLLPLDEALLVLPVGAAFEGFRIELGFSLTLFRIALVMLVMRWLVSRIREGNRSLPAGPLTWPVLAWTGSLALSWLSAPDKAYGMRVLLIYLSGAVCVLLVADLARSRRALSRLIVALLVVGLLGAAHGLVQLAGHPLGVDTYGLERVANASGIFSLHFREKAPPDGYLRLLCRPHSFFIDWNVFAGFLQSVWPLMLALTLYVWLHRPRRWLVAWGILASSLVTVLIFGATFSRSSWFGALLALATLIPLLWHWLTDRRVLRFLAGCLAAMVVAFATGLVPVSALTLRVSTLVNPPQSSALNQSWYLRDVVSARHHFKLLGLCADAFRASPLLGVGTGGFPLFFNEHAPEWMFTPNAMARTDDRLSGMMAHSALFNSFAEGGIARGITYLWIVIAAIAAPYRAVRRLPADDRRRAILAGLLGCVTGVIGGNVFYDYTTQPFFWFVLALAAVASQVYADENAVSGYSA